ncbi:MAG: hypothetical protein FI695_01870 [SAR202 cluster bacterium]|nr:hypothetical protein [Chloroflexota bacterium]MQG50711.1 hypothetical protein [SAR202 cluster bacterium]|tara:strand:- start:501 stop:926 length:426 start_codon:yes stop_codon:yes gene_type:complete
MDRLLSAFWVPFIVVFFTLGLIFGIGEAFTYLAHLEHKRFGILEPYAVIGATILTLIAIGAAGVAASENILFRKIIGAATALFIIILAIYLFIQIITATGTESGWNQMADFMAIITAVLLSGSMILGTILTFRRLQVIDNE